MLENQSQELLSASWEESLHPMTRLSHHGASRETCQLIPLGKDLVGRAWV